MFAYYLVIVNRIGKQENCDHSTRKRSDRGPCYHKNKEAEQAIHSAQQVCHEEGVSPNGQGCFKPGKLYYGLLTSFTINIMV